MCDPVFAPPDILDVPLRRPRTATARYPDPEVRRYSRRPVSRPRWARNTRVAAALPLPAALPPVGLSCRPPAAPPIIVPPPPPGGHESLVDNPACAADCVH